MKNKTADWLSFCSSIDFGAVNLCREEEAFRGGLNREMLSLCESLPECTRTEAVLFLMAYLHAPFSEGLNFVNYFYAPAWSILYWLHRSRPPNRRPYLRYLKDAKAGHTMAMFLHAFDDHLADDQLATTHLALLMRSQAWLIMSGAFERLARGVRDGPTVVHGFVNDYYSSIAASGGTGSLDNYCDLFKKQMATWLVVPVLMAKRAEPDGELADSIQAVYSSFGIAWRLLDDVQDVEKDMNKGSHSSLYACLPDEIRKGWDAVKDEKADGNGGYAGQVLDFILGNGIIDTIRQRIWRELESAASTADSCCMAEYADELRCLSRPLKEIGRIVLERKP